MYLRDERILFVHIPRNAAQSVTVFFYDCLGILDLFANTNGYNEIREEKTIEELYNSDSPNERYLFAKNNRWKVPGPIVLTYMTMQEYIDYEYISRDELPYIKKIVTVRNPYERIISACNYRSVAPNRSWIQKVAEYDKFNSEKSRYFMRQSDFLKVDGEIAVDHIVKVEDIHTISSLVSDQLNTEGKKIPHFNKAPEELLYQRVINEEVIAAKNVQEIKRETIDWINDYYHEDFERFGYEKV